MIDKIEAITFLGLWRVECLPILSHPLAAGSLQEARATERGGDNAKLQWESPWAHRPIRLRSSIHSMQLTFRLAATPNVK